MPFDQLDRFKVHCKPLKERPNKVHIETDHVPADATPKPLGAAGDTAITEIVKRLITARETGASRMLAFGDAGQVVVSSITRELAGSSTFDYVDLGERELKGVEGPRRLFAATIRG